METELGLVPSGRAAISFRPVSSGEFGSLQQQIDDLLATSVHDSPLTWRSFDDDYGYHWIILQAADFDNLVATAHMVNRELQDGGYGERLLASVFQFRGRNNATVYWVYNYKRGAFYPFVPTATRERDNAQEIHLSSVMGPEMHLEEDMTRWYPLWGIPLGE